MSEIVVKGRAVRSNRGTVRSGGAGILLHVAACSSGFLLPDNLRRKGRFPLSPPQEEVTLVDPAVERHRGGCVRDDPQEFPRGRGGPAQDEVVEKDEHKTRKNVKPHTALS